VIYVVQRGASGACLLDSHAKENLTSADKQEVRRRIENIAVKA
jgi:hypothetical protein